MAVELKTNAIFLEALLASVDMNSLSEEMKQQYLATQANIQEAQKAEKLKLVLTGLNDQLLINAKLIKDKLAVIEIPESINTVKLAFGYDAESKLFAPASENIPVDSSFPLITRLDREVVNSMDEESKPFQKTLTEILNDAGKTAYKVDNFVDLVRQKQSWMSGALTEIMGLNTSATANGLTVDINVEILAEIDTDKGSVVFSYNSKAQQAKGDKETEYTPWIISTCAFGKTTKYTQSKGNGRKSKAVEWIPAGYEATTVKAYVMERFGDSDDKLKKLKESGTDFNANQHLLRIEKMLEESDRAYTDHLALQKKD